MKEVAAKFQDKAGLKPCDVSVSMVNNLLIMFGLIMFLIMLWLIW